MTSFSNKSGYAVAAINKQAEEELGTFQSGMSVRLKPHSVNIIQILEK